MRELPSASPRSINLTVQKRTIDVTDVEALGFRCRLVPLPVGRFGGALSGSGRWCMRKPERLGRIPRKDD
jgi:hypothetical protein